MEALTRQNLRPEIKADGALVLYENGAFADALKIARKMRSSSIKAELMPVPNNKTGYESYLKGLKRQQTLLVKADGSCLEL